MRQDLSLDNVTEQKAFRVTRLTGPQPSRVRMLQMGLTPGTSVTVLRRAPLADPVEICVRGTKIVLRRDECRHIQVAGEE
jgi:Fe2+ transport system protein FeoA